MNIDAQLKFLNDLLLKINYDVSEKENYYQKKILENIRLIEDLKNKISREFGDLYIQEVLLNCDIKTFEFIQYHVQLVKTFSLMVETKVYT